MRILKMKYGRWNLRYFVSPANLRQLALRLLPKPGDGTDLRQEAIAVMHRPHFDALAAGEEIDLHSGRRNRFSRRGKSQKLAPVGAVKREPMGDLFAFRHDVVDLDAQIREAFEQTGVVFLQPRQAGPDAAGIAMVNDRIAKQREISIQVPHSESRPGALHGGEVFLWGHILFANTVLGTVRLNERVFI